MNREGSLKSGCLLQLFHYALDQFLCVRKAFHHDLDVERRPAWPALALAIDTVLSDQGHGISDHVHGHGEAAAGNAHHGLEMIDLFAFFLENRHVTILTAMPLRPELLTSAYPR